MYALFLKCYINGFAVSRNMFWFSSNFTGKVTVFLAFYSFQKTKSSQDFPSWLVFDIVTMMLFPRTYTVRDKNVWIPNKSHWTCAWVNQINYENKHTWETEQWKCLTEFFKLMDLSMNYVITTTTIQKNLLSCF